MENVAPERMLSCLCLSNVKQFVTLISSSLQCPSEALSALFRRGGFTHVQHVRPNKEGLPQARERRTAVQHFLACEGHFMACCDIHLVPHDNFWPINSIRLPNSESRISNQVIAAKLVTLNSR